MRTKKVYVNSGEVTGIEIIFVHSDFIANASGAKDARDEGIRESHILLHVNKDTVDILDPRIKTRSCAK